MKSCIVPSSKINDSCHSNVLDARVSGFTAATCTVSPDPASTPREAHKAQPGSPEGSLGPESAASGLNPPRPQPQSGCKARAFPLHLPCPAAMKCQRGHGFRQRQARTLPLGCWRELAFRVREREGPKPGSPIALNTHNLRGDPPRQGGHSSGGWPV